VRSLTDDYFSVHERVHCAVIVVSPSCVERNRAASGGAGVHYPCVPGCWSGVDSVRAASLMVRIAASSTVRRLSLVYPRDGRMDRYRHIVIRASIEAALGSGAA